MAEQKQRKRAPYNFLYTPLELKFIHQEARRIADSGEFVNITRAYYQLETSLIPVVGRDQMSDLIEMYQERGRQALEKMNGEIDRLEELIESHDALVAFESDSIDEAIDEMRTRDHEVSTVEYSRSAGGQNAFLDLMQRFDRACVLVEILAQANALSPIQRYDSLNHLRSIVTELTRFVKRQYNKAVALGKKQSVKRKSGGEQGEGEEESEPDSNSTDAEQSTQTKSDESKSPAGGAEESVADTEDVATASQALSQSETSEHTAT